MKQRIFGLLVLTGILSTCTLHSAYAQRGHYGGRINAGPRYSTPRVYSAPGPRYIRTVPGPGPRVVVHGGITVNRGYPGYYHYRGYRPYYRYYYPPVGFYVNTLPYGYFSLGTAFGPVYYYGGTYYSRSNNQQGYDVVDAPTGAMVPNLPDGAQEVTVDGNVYYDVNGTYYQEVMTDSGRRYKVVGKSNSEPNNTYPDDQDAQPDELLAELPEGTRSVKINNQEYWLSPDGMYYQYVESNGTSGYKVVGKTDAGE
ncbi:DUF6515 family protein [Chitinophaga sp. sic0106]|uniref:DUF6515 family protein n=1 Tax=Chitinophaga sp. sic0106 TaxID=2854785 RepID=UPI001C450C5B|nr:DUF6515 family protein [Chitinophaga sp. sic0106]MBV7532971.1 hypothetical protein [Chitinophaga sp. sic0106]